MEHERGRFSPYDSQRNKSNCSTVQHGHELEVACIAIHMLIIFGFGICQRLPLPFDDQQQVPKGVHQFRETTEK